MKYIFLIERLCLATLQVSVCSLKGGGGDNWMNPMTRQFQNMGLMVSPINYVSEERMVTMHFLLKGS